MISINRMTRGFVYLTYLLVVCSLAIEIVFRFLPVSESTQVMPVNPRAPFAHFSPNREINLQIGFDFSHVVKKRINNYGFMSNTDFRSERDVNIRRTVVIGDSFVEAFQVPNRETFHDILDQMLPSREIYPIGISGAPLSQYLAYAVFSEMEFNPDSYIFLIIGNDFDESLLKNKAEPPHHYFDNSGKLTLSEFEPNPAASILIKSAFLRFLYFDLKLQHQFARLWGSLNQEKSMKDDQITSPERNSEGDTVLAVNLFFTHLKDIVGQKPVLLVFDGDRRSIYEMGAEVRRRGASARAYSEMVLLAEKSENVQVLDLHRVFYESYQTFGRKFEYPYDSHWNENGHATAAQAIVATGFLDN